MMQERTAVGRRQRVLLSGVFGPFGVDDAFGRRENIMELFHNQVTRGQGVASFRFHHRSFGLYFLAANVDADVTVLDFPSRRRFVRELRRGWDVVGISFIAPNFVKAREMARLARLHAPGATIVLGGHGAAIEGIEESIVCDHVVRGEGIGPLRRLLGQDPDAPIVHPALPSTERQSILGVPLLGRTASLLVPGLGCVNGCRFCSTTHFFGKTYTPYLRTGRDLFAACCRIADLRGTDDFFVMDENFLKDTARARELLAEMERHRRFFRFQVFSSAEAITAFGLDELVRLGVTFVWMGVECKSRQANFAKNSGVDPRALVRALRDRGINVLASGILCMEHHTPDNIQEDIDHLTDLEADFVQFMLLTPLPVTELYREKQAAGLLREELPYEEWHGQKMLNWRHPHFPADEAERWLRRAFRQEYEENSSSMLRVADTALRGYEALAALEQTDACLEARLAQMRARAREYSLILPAIARTAVNS
ncbi:MAG TPA: cobalamin-dependent protein, partial [bacterium]